ncbi:MULTISPECIES: hypothetical protein [unclassified Microcoleus]|uniref:hypothetical protein n=1 Tax=unclassified Microcoleus TaxID=2642155 RepID=UPI002FD75D5E
MLQNSPSRGLIAIGKSEFLAVFSNAKIPSLFLITILSIAPLPLRRLYRERSPITHQERSPVTPNTKHWDDCTEIDALHTKYQVDVCGTIKVKLMINLSKINTIN